MSNNKIQPEIEELKSIKELLEESKMYNSFQNKLTAAPKLFVASMFLMMVCFTLIVAFKAHTLSQGAGLETTEATIEEIQSRFDYLIGQDSLSDRQTIEILQLDSMINTNNDEAKQ